MSSYPHLLAVAARPFGGASSSDWLSVLGSRVDPVQRRSLKPVAESLAELSGYGTGPLFAGSPAFGSGLEALQQAHESAFGPSVPLAAMLSAVGATESVKDSERRPSLPRQLADDLLKANEAAWRTGLVNWLNTIPLALRSALDVARWINEQRPNEVVPPLRLRSLARAAGIDWNALVDGLCAATDETCELLVERTSAALRRESLPGVDLQAKAARCLDSTFLHRHFRKVVWRGIESMHLHGKLVGRVCAASYVSTAGFHAWAGAKKAQHEWLLKTVVRDKTGKCKPRLLAEVVRTPEADRAELLTFLVGIDILAREEGFVPALITLTLPPAWHPNPSRGSSCWGGAGHTPDAALKWLNKQWAMFLRDLDNQGIRLAGLRVVEPHKDGCPHQHVLAYMRPNCESAVLAALCNRFGVHAVKLRTSELRKSGSKKTRSGKCFDTVVSHFDAASGSERAGDGGAHRIEFSRINSDVATATSYVSKYLMKTLNPIDLRRDSASEAAAHAAGWGYRRFALFGIRKTKTLWRELRRADKPLSMDATGEALWGFAKSGEFASFLRLLGGLRPGGGMKVRTVCEPRTTAFGEEVLAVVGAEVADAMGGIVIRVITHELGRFELVPLDLEELTFEPPDD